ncbi:MAG: sulfatase-like hydrolase/transferase [Bacteroidota bacterium]
MYQLVLLFFGIMMISCKSQSPEQDQDPPNIIFILTDDQGWTHSSHRADPNVPLTKSDFYETPNMDELASLGVTFVNGYAPNPICSPTRHSVMLGQNAARHIYNQDVNWYKKGAERLTIPKALKNANKNYISAHFGKWHIAIDPTQAGFDQHDGLTSNSHGNVFNKELLGAREYAESTKQLLDKLQAENPASVTLAGKPSTYWNDDNPKDIFGLTQKAESFMKSSIEAGRPFYVQISHYATHLGLSAREDTYQYFKEKQPGERHANPEFAAMLKDLDTSVGEIMNFVEELGIADNTYIFLMGDNGGRLSLNQIAIIDENKTLVSAKYSEEGHRNLPLRDGKHSFYEGGLRVPFLAMGPGIQANRMSDVRVTGLDLLPTFASLADRDFVIGPTLDGGSLLPLLEDAKVTEVKRNREALIFHQAAHRKPRSAIIKGDYKLVKYWIEETKYENTPKVELFNIKEDLGESYDMASELLETTSELETELTEFLKEVNAETAKVDIDDPFDRLVKELEGE